jgi:uncharacterized protein (TIGR03435 family)
MMSPCVRWQLDSGRGLLLVVAITMVIVVPVPAASQAVMLNADHSGGMLHATAARPSFEVASIRQRPPDAECAFGGIPKIQPDGIEIRCLSIKDVIEFAYAVPNEKEFSGGPDWIRTEEFDITAKPGDAEALMLSKLSPTDQRVQMGLMLQSLLEERLQLKVSFAMKDLSFLALVVAKGGFKCTKVAPDGAVRSILPPPPPPPPPPIGPPAPGHEPEVWRTQPNHMVMHKWPVSHIAAWITVVPELEGRIVVDKTGLNGVFDCELSWAHEGTDAPAPSFFTAIQEQMGLKLQPEKGPVETIVVDHIEKPSPN